MLTGRDEPVPSPAEIERHQQVEILVGVAGEDEGREARLGDLDPQLFLQLADQALLRRLPGLDLAAGKLPKPGQLLAGGPLADQHPPVGVDQRRGGDQQQAFGLRH